MKKTVIFALFIIIFSNSIFALTMSKADFGTVAPGDKLVKTIMVGADIRDNTYRITTEGETANWIKASPIEIFVPASHSEDITLVLDVPSDVKNGSYTGLIVATAQNPIGATDGTSVGYILQIKSRVVVNIGTVTEALAQKNTEEKFESVSIIDLYAIPEKQIIGKNVDLYVKLINSGTLATSANVNLEVIKDNKVISTLSSSTPVLEIGQDNLIKLVWKTNNLLPGNYQIMARTMKGNRPISYGPITVQLSNEITNTEQASSSAQEKQQIPYLTIILIVIITILIIEYIRLKLRLRKDKTAKKTK